MTVMNGEATLTISRILQDAGCRNWYLFGSCANGTESINSDIDIGVCSLEPRIFYKVHSRLERALKRPVDLVDFDEHKEMFELLLRNGQLQKG